MDQPQVGYKLEAAALGLDGFGQRAPLGTRYLLLTVLATSQEDKYDAYVGTDSFRLVVAGQSEGPDTRDPVAMAIPHGSQQEFHLAFLVPADAASADLEVGEAGKSTVRIPIALSPRKP